MNHKSIFVIACLFKNSMLAFYIIQLKFVDSYLKYVFVEYLHLKHIQLVDLLKELAMNIIFLLLNKDG